MRKDPRSFEIWKIQSRRAVLASIAMAAVAPVGCLAKYFSKPENEPAANQVKSTPAAKGRLVCIWDKKVNFSEDQTRGGAIMPVLVGRVYLVDSDVKVHLGDGSLIIDLYDCSPGTGHAKEPKMLEELRIDPDNLKRFAKKDFIGDGYHIMFPWYTYRPEITNVNIIMRYEEDGKFWTETSGGFAVNHDEAIERIRKGLSVVNPAMRETALLPASATSAARPGN